LRKTCDRRHNFHGATITQLRTPREFGFKSKEKDKQASDHQREHPDQIDVEPGPAQNADTELFVNQDCQKASYQKITQRMYGN
jgi:hypothetical protein